MHFIQPWGLSSSYSKILYDQRNYQKLKENLCQFFINQMLWVLIIIAILGLLPYLKYMGLKLPKATVKFLNFRTPKILAVSYLKFKQGGQTLGYFVKMVKRE